MDLDPRIRNPEYGSGSKRPVVKEAVEYRTVHHLLLLTSVLRIRIQDPVPFWPRDPGWVESQDPDPGSRIRDEQPGSYFPELRNHFFVFLGVTILKFFDADPGSGMETVRIRDPGSGMETVRIRDGKKSDPGPRILIFTHPGSRIQKQQQKRGVKKIVIITFYVATNFTKLQIILVLKKKIFANFQRIIELFTQRIVNKLSKIWVWDPRSGIRKNLFRSPDPWVKKAPDPGSRIRIRNTVRNTD
jgi:hypothetical protein